MIRQDKNHLVRLVFTGPKGGTGKTTMTALVTEYLLYQNKKVNLVDTDPNQALQTWINNCQEEGRTVSQPLPTDYQILDAAGVKGGVLTSADYLIVPLIPHYVDLQVILNWFVSLPLEQQNKVYFLPNRYQKTKEQQEGLQLLNKTRQDHKVNIFPPLPNRPALFAPLLNGSKVNFFQTAGGKPFIPYFQQLFKQLGRTISKTQSPLINHA